jgi:hypothetical protein
LNHCGLSSVSRHGFLESVITDRFKLIRPLLQQMRASREGHGTHVATTAAGSVLQDDSDSDDAAAEVARFNSLASGAQLAVVDIGVTGQAYLR